MRVSVSTNTASAFAIDARLRLAKPAKFASSASISNSKPSNPEVKAVPRSQILFEAISRKFGA
jgi:hypothetical protein